MAWLRCHAFSLNNEICYTAPMTTATLIKEFKKKGFVMIPREEYDELKANSFRVDNEPITASEKRAFAQARKDLKAGKLLTLDEFARKMGRKR